MMTHQHANSPVHKPHTGKTLRDYRCHRTTKTFAKPRNPWERRDPRDLLDQRGLQTRRERRDLCDALLDRDAHDHSTSLRHHNRLKPTAVRNHEPTCRNYATPKINTSVEGSNR